MTQIKNGDKLYVITRDDLPKGIQAVQAIHSAIQFNFEFCEIAKEWHSNSDYLALLSVANESELQQLIDKTQTKGIKYSVYREPDLDNQITSICLEPSNKSKKLCSSIKLALKE